MTLPASGCPVTGDGVGTTEGEADADGLGVGATCGFGDALGRAVLVGVGGATELAAGALLTGAAGELTAAEGIAGEGGSDATSGGDEEPAAGLGLADTSRVGATAALRVDVQALAMSATEKPSPTHATARWRRVGSVRRGMVHADTPRRYGPKWCPLWSCSAATTRSRIYLPRALLCRTFTTDLYCRTFTTDLYCRTFTTALLWRVFATEQSKQKS